VFPSSLILVSGDILVWNILGEENTGLALEHFYAISNRSAGQDEHERIGINSDSRLVSAVALHPAN
jgi:hypothetical protein